MNLTTLGENHLLAEFFAKVAVFTPPSAYFIGLFRGDPGEAGAITSEVTGGSYARVNITSLLGEPSNGFIRNTTDILFPEATANWGAITHIGILNSNALGAGLMVAYASLAGTVTINNGEQFKMNASTFWGEGL